MFRNWNFFFFFFKTSSFVQMHWVCWANAVFLDLSFFPCLCFTMPAQLCNVASWAVVQSDVQPSKLFLKVPAVTYQSMRIHWSHVTVCHTGEVLKIFISLFPFLSCQKRWSVQRALPFLLKFKNLEIKEIVPAQILSSS
jgi:hypothetical protein